MSQLKVYKASAGSGKTFRLAIEYMKLALTNQTNYRHILAVTFTNKATAEMKSRIVGELYQLAKGNDSAYLRVLSDELGWTPNHVQLQAQLVLKRILHDYSRFSISTIDSFFQHVIKAFNRELGINAAYNVELDEFSILEEATDRLIQSVENNAELLDWLQSFANDKMRDGKGWNLKKDIIGLGSELFSETFRSLNDDLYEKLNDRSFLKEYRKKLAEIISKYENSLKTLGNSGLRVLASEGLSLNDFKGKNRGPATVFQKLKDLNTDFSNTVLVAANDSSAWVTASTAEPQKSKLLAVAEAKLMPILQQAIQLTETEGREYITAKLVINQLYTLGILVDLGRYVKDLCREKGVILISDSAHLLKDVIGDSEAPFVYEKTGANYFHFMIDEFQDTSGLQWNNFKPLIDNSLSENNVAMVVGDVKQAIYRWRSGDWRLLASKLTNSFPVHGLKDEVLNSNWRSHGNIIRFNNTIFNQVPCIIQQNIDVELADSRVSENPVGITIPEVYADCIQEISNQKTADKGLVRVQFLESKKELTEANERTTLSNLIESIKSLQDKGVKANDIAILVRDKKKARIIADLFLEQKGISENVGYNFNILSGESLFISNSDVISLIIALLTHHLNPDDQIIKTQINYLYFNSIYPRLKAVDKLPVFSSTGKTEESTLQLNLFQEATKAQKSDSANNSSAPLSVFETNELSESEMFAFLSGNNFQEMVAGKPILEIVYNICEKFNLFAIVEELAYLEAFIDQISVFERNHTSDLTSFLDWWSDNGPRFTVPVSENIDAIHVLTIHKSKGLEFDHVFIPYLDWSIQPQTSAEKAPLLWCKADKEPFNDIDVLPVRYKSDVGKSVFYREYFFEKFNTFIDNLNLMYVAFTRAKKGLYIWASYTGKFSTVGDLLKLSAEQITLNSNKELIADKIVDFAKNYDKENNILIIGNQEYIEDEKSGRDHIKSVQIEKLEFVDFRKFLQIKKNGEDFFSRENKRQTSINKGKIIHEILSGVKLIDDLPKAVKKMEADGKIEKNEVAPLISELNKLLSKQETRHWFDGKYKILTERNILTGPTGIKRPDRIMVGDNETIAVDYKSGDAESDKYKYQLRSYITELTKCGFENVSGFIWYTRLNKLVRI